ncbi:MAG TPA: type II toxin-antitoxin system RelE/ParE family toxin [Pirellulales bacterium]|nr:type II toxin-antitoxin system RelE/ParE family toxin [Pirellulales bacterium]
MNRFAIKWRRTALNDLAEIWLTSENRSQITLAVETIEKKLSERPEQAADRQVEGLFVISEHPVRIGFTIDQASFVVTIVGLGILK